MSYVPTPPPSVPPAPPPRHGCLTALMLLIGVILLLPGICALIFGATMLGEHFDGTVAALVFLGLVVGAGGVIVLWATFRRPRG